MAFTSSVRLDDERQKEHECGEDSDSDDSSADRRCSAVLHRFVAFGISHEPRQDPSTGDAEVEPVVARLAVT